MNLDKKVGKHMGGYLLSSDFENLCNALDFDYYDIRDIKERVADADDKSDVEDLVALLVYEKYLLCNANHSKEVISKKYLHGMLHDRSPFFYRVFIRSPSYWQDIKNKLHAGISSGKINSHYLLEKEFRQELDVMSSSKVDNALKEIYVAELMGMTDNLIHDLAVKITLLEDAFKGEYYANPLYFNKVKSVFDKKLKVFLANPLIKTKSFHNNSIFASEIIIRNKELANFIDVLEDDDENNDCIFSKGIGYSSKFLYALTSGAGNAFKERDDLSNIYIIKKELVGESEALIVDPSSDLAKRFSGYVDDSIDKTFFDHGDDYKKYLLGGGSFDDYRIEKFNDFKLEIFRDSKSGRTLHIFDVLDSDERAEEYDHRDLIEIVSKDPLSYEYLDLISSLNISIKNAYKIRFATRKNNDYFLEFLARFTSKRHSHKIISKNELLSHMDKLHVMTILNSREDDWDEINEDLTHRINSNEIKSLSDLYHKYQKRVKSSLKAGISNAKIEALLDFKEKDYSYAPELAYHIRDKDILYNELGDYLNSLTDAPPVKQKEYLDDGKFAAPRWLVYPELDAFTIGWRMGYGEDYAMNEPWHTEEFKKLFPMPQNWMVDRRNLKYERYPSLGYFWREDGKPKYSKITEDAIKVNDFITFEQNDGEFRYNANRFESIEHAVLNAKYLFFGKIDFYRTKFYVLKRGFELTDEQIEYWKNFKYTVLLNACYYKFMQDESLKQKLLSTGDKALVYISDDEWGGDDNLLGFALMELRDEIRRLYENEDLIDWEFTEYLKHLNPYENPKPRNPEDKQSPEYMVVSSTINSSKFYVRDADLPDELAGKYSVGQVLTERAFVDATDKIGGLVTTHRYLILSNKMKDLSEFETQTNWGLHVANARSKFKVLDIYEKDGKTQIFLLQLPDGFESVFENEISIIKESVSEARNMFDECLDKDAIAEVTSPDWLERVSFPIGMNDKGEFF